MDGGQNDKYIFSTILADSKENRFIKLTTYNPITRVKIGEYSINHFLDGIYLKTDIPAFNEGVILARYEVFKDSMLTQKDRSYSVRLAIIRVENFVEQLNISRDDEDGMIS